MAYGGALRSRATMAATRRKGETMMHVSFRTCHARRFHPAALLLGATGLLILAAGIVLARGPLTASAAEGPCGTSHDELTTEEISFLQNLADWRSANGYSSTFVTSGPLNAAAAWFAEYLVNGGQTNGHSDSYGRTWVQRAIDCGYTGTTSNGTPLAYGSGEGTFFLQASVALDVGPYDAVFGGTVAGQTHQGVTYPSSGVHLPGTQSLPAKCIGAAKAQNASGTSVAWIVVIAQWQANVPCPQEITGTGGESSPTPTPTETPTVSPTPTSTPVPTPEWIAFAPAVVSNP